MRRTFELATVAGLRLTAKPSALIASLLLWAILTLVATMLLDLPLPNAILGALAAVGIHWLSILVHHLGHAWAARRTGWPMAGIAFVGLLAASVYPRNEPQLPADIHIRRALGGPFASLLLASFAALLALAARDTGGLAWFLALFLLLDNLFVFVLGALLPLGFTDGSTILYWRAKR